MNSNCYGCGTNHSEVTLAIHVTVELTVIMLVSTDLFGVTISIELEPINIKQLRESWSAPGCFDVLNELTLFNIQDFLSTCLNSVLKKKYLASTTHFIVRNAGVISVREVNVKYGVFTSVSKCIMVHVC